jgi:type IV pilus assembly protein PilB
MSHTPQALGDYLVNHKLITRDQLSEAIQAQLRSGQPLSQILVSMRFVAEDKLLRAMAAQMGVAPWFIEKDQPQPEALQFIPNDACDKHQILPVQVRGDLLVLAMRNPLDLEVIELARNLSKKRIEPVLAIGDKLVRAIERAAVQLADPDRMDGYVAQALSNAGEGVQRAQNVLSEEDTRPVVGLVNQILSDAIRMGASDIHLEPRASRVDVRFRLDGELQRVKELPPDLMPMLSTRLKIMAELDIVETRLPQDGHMNVQLDGREVDVRLSVLPNAHGQRFVLRILDKSFSLKKLTELGMNERNLGMFRSLISKPYGMLLVTGPTGSGKTTSLYAALREILKSTTNVMTCEDPIEYEIEGINQSQVNEKIGLTFAAQLRAVLRQDPDVILVGEIRDRETADTAIRAALTGHLVLSTLHCNDAPSAVPRLLDMGIDPFVLSTCLIGVTSQRLVRVLCPHCRQKDEQPEEAEVIETVFGTGDRPPIYKGVGCPICMRTGYRGRIGVHELLPVTPEVASAIASRRPMPEVRAVAARFGYEPLQVDAMRRVLEGRTSLAEAKRQVFFETWGSPRDEGAPTELPEAA